MQPIVRVGIVLVAVCLALAAPAFAIAPRGGDNIVVDTPLTDDLYAGGGTITVTARVDGDVVAAGNTVSVEAPVTGGVLAAGRTVRVRGDVGRAIRAAAATVDLDATVGTDAAVAGFQVRLGPRTRIARDLAASGSDIEIAGSVGRRAYIGGETVRLAGTFGGDVSVEASRLVVLPSARIAGRLSYRSDAVADVREGAQITGGVERTARAEAPSRVGGPNMRPFGGFHFFETVWLLVLGLLAIAVAHRGTEEVVQRVSRRFGASFLIGLLLVMVAPVAALLLFVTIVGIPLSITGIFVILFTLYLGQVFVAAWLGGQIVRRVAPATNTPYGEMAVGVLVLAILFLIPGLGWLLRAIAAFAGFGALWWVLYRRVFPAGAGGAPASVA